MENKRLKCKYTNVSWFRYFEHFCVFGMNVTFAVSIRCQRINSLKIYFMKLILNTTSSMFQTKTWTYSDDTKSGVVWNDRIFLLAEHQLTCHFASSFPLSFLPVLPPWFAYFSLSRSAVEGRVWKEGYLKCEDFERRWTLR